MTVYFQEIYGIYGISKVKLFIAFATALEIVINAVEDDNFDRK